MAQPASELLTTLLRGVSRSFYLTMRVLPAAIRPQIGLAYLLARATDTIADTDIIPIETRLQALEDFRERILGQRNGPLDFGKIARSEVRGAREERERVRAGSPTLPTPERVLLERMEEMLLLLNGFSAADQDLIREVLQTITSGQMMDLRRFGGGTASHILSLQTHAELDDYTYRVAGCVGEFWTRICRAHLFPKALLDEAGLLGDGVRFGKGLQLVNILRDVPGDLRQGRSYLPAEDWQRFGLTPAAMLEPANEPAFRPLYELYLNQAEAHLAAGWAYTNALPRRCVRVRLACAWPLLIGVRTVGRLRAGNVLDPAHRIKVGRAEVRKLVARSMLAYPWPRAWDRLFRLTSAGSGRARGASEPQDGC